MIEALINIIAVIAIIAIGAFVIVVLSDLLISIIDGKNGIFFKRGNKKEEDELPERPKMVNHSLEEEKPQELEQQPAVQIDYTESNLQETDNEEKVEEVQEDYDFSSFVDEIVEPKKPAKSNESYIDEITEITRTMLEDEEVQEVNEEAESCVEEVEEDSEDENKQELDAMRAELEEQRKAYEALLVEKQEAEERNKQLESEKDTLQKALEEQEKNITDNQEQSVAPAESLEELTARLEMLEERLRTNEKLLKTNKKEYLPLAKINKSLENDTKKLRRKEAKVAKQKVMLYGVNNFVDIDEEKAKELNEELDLLEGLRLSVKHCEDVMNANKDRYPILEQTNKILTNAVQEIKSDIADVKAKIDAINAKNADADNANEENN